MKQYDAKSSIYTHELIERLAGDEQHQKAQALSVVNRRSFLITSALGATGLALSPLEKLMAMQTEDECEKILKLLPQKPRKGFWDTLFSLLFRIFTALGYGKLIGTGIELARRIAEKAADAQLISEGLNQRLKRLTAKGYQYLDESKWPIGDVGPYNYFNLARLNHCKKYFLSALKSDKLNGLTSFYNAAVSLNNPTTELLGPSMIFHNLFGTELAKKLGYTDVNEMIRAIYPFEQKDEAVGGFETSYRHQEKFITDSGAIIVMGYDAKPSNKSGIIHYDIAKILDKKTNSLVSLTGQSKIDWSKG